MDFTRREFIYGSGAAALVAGCHVLGFAARPASAASPTDPILVLVNLSGGNDALNTVVPLGNAAGVAQRSLYEQMRPDLRISTAALAATQIDDDPELGNPLALHPAMSPLHALYESGNVAVINGVGYPDNTLSHFASEARWWSGDPTGVDGTGWLGRYIDERNTGEVNALSFGSEVNASFESISGNALGLRRIDRFDLPDDPEREYRDLDARRARWSELFEIARTPGSAIERAAGNGASVLAKSEQFDEIETAWGSANESNRGSLARKFREIASILRYDAQPSVTPTGLCLFHVGQSGYDTHSEQGTTGPNDRHANLLAALSNAISAFYADCVALGVDDRVIVLTYSEFGRRASQNDSGNSAGTDHGNAVSMFAVGTPVVGGVFGRVPELDNLDDADNQRFHTDFRRVYATLMDQWLGSPGTHTSLLTGSPWSPMGFLP